MFCSKCGNSISQDAKFCKKCGVSISGTIGNHTPPQAIPAPQPIPSIPASSVQPPPPVVPKKKNGGLIYILAGVGVIVLVCVSLFLFKGGLVEKLSEVEEDMMARVHIQGPILNLRAGPSTDAEVLFQLPKGAKLKVYVEEKSGKWAKVQYEDIVGYVVDEFLVYLDKSFAENSWLFGLWEEIEYWWLPTELDFKSDGTFLMKYTQSRADGTYSIEGNELILKGTHYDDSGNERNWSKTILKNTLLSDWKKTEEWAVSDRLQAEALLEPYNVTDPQYFVISNRRVGAFVIGQRMPTQVDRFRITKEKIEEDWETYVKYTVYDVQKMMLIYTEGTSDIIERIIILSERFKTEQNIGINSTLEEVVAVYSDFDIYYYGVCNIRTGRLDRVFFELPGGSLKEGVYKDYDERVRLSDLKEGSKIKKINIGHLGGD